MSGSIRTLCLGLIAAASAACSSGFDVQAPRPEQLPLQDRLAPDEGAIVSVVATSVTRPYESLEESAKARFDPEVWAAAREQLRGRADIVTYSSDGLRIGGFLVRPEGIGGRRVGAVIVNRDGIADRGLDEDEILVELSRYAARGYVAAASAYRGNRMSQGVDQLGGDDVHDVLSLALLLQRLDYVDPARIFMVGFGRGGLMTLRAIEEGAPVRAAAVISGIADMEEYAKLTPEVEAGFSSGGEWPGLAEIHGPWDGAVRGEELARRSANLGGDDSAVPLLLVHGRLDEQVPVHQAQAVASRLQAAGVPYESILYGYGDHDLTEQRADWQARVLEWIDRHDSRALFN